MIENHELRANALLILETSVSSREAAESLAGRLLEEKLIACVSWFEVTSRYTWEACLTQEAEWILHMKTLPQLRATLVNRLRALHPYEVPMILSWSVDSLNADYTSWAGSSVRQTLGEENI